MEPQEARAREFPPPLALDRSTVRLLVLVLAVSLAAIAAAPAAAQESTHCVDVTPDPFAPAPDAELRIIVMHDGPALERAQQVVAKAAEYYAPVGLRLTAVFAPLDGEASGGDALPLMELARAHVGATIGVWAHAAVVLTDRDVRDGPADANGRAWCIGGIADHQRAYAVVENRADEAPGIGPIDETEHATAKTLAHEIGHLLAARHEHHNCAEDAADQPERVTPCTIMWLSGGITGNRFGILETQVIRTFAAEYVKPLQPVPVPAAPPAPSPSPPAAAAATPAPAAARPPATRCRAAQAAVRRARRTLARHRRGRSRRQAVARLRRARATARRACRSGG